MWRACRRLSGHEVGFCQPRKTERMPRRSRRGPAYTLQVDRSPMESEPSKVVVSQNESHGEGHDYVKGSPHLRHTVLRSMIELKLQELVHETMGRVGTCRVLEIGAGHGTFTEFLLDAGAIVTVTEASEASAATLREKYAGRDTVEVFYDRTGESVFDREPEYDAVVCASLLHHIPDYLDFVRRLSGLNGLAAGSTPSRILPTTPGAHALRTWPAGPPTTSGDWAKESFVGASRRGCVICAASARRPSRPTPSSITSCVRVSTNSPSRLCLKTTSTRSSSSPTGRHRARSFSGCSPRQVYTPTSA